MNATKKQDRSDRAYERGLAESRQLGPDAANPYEHLFGSPQGYLREAWEAGRNYAVTDGTSVRASATVIQTKRGWVRLIADCFEGERFVWVRTGRITKHRQAAEQF